MPRNRHSIVSSIVNLIVDVACLSMDIISLRRINIPCLNLALKKVRFFIRFLYLDKCRAFVIILSVFISKSNDPLCYPFAFSKFIPYRGARGPGYGYPIYTTVPRKSTN
eukprot:469017_1